MSLTSGQNSSADSFSNKDAVTGFQPVAEPDPATLENVLPTHCSAYLKPNGYLHLQEGPIDLVIGVQGSERATLEAYERMNAAFGGVLHELVSELVFLRQPVVQQLGQLSDNDDHCPFRGSIARSMWQSCLRLVRLAERHTALQQLTNPLTAMAGIAGAVADYVLAAGKAVPGVEKVWVNNGGDIAVYLTGNVSFNCGIVGLENLQCESFSNYGFIEEIETGRQICLRERDHAGGIATSGRHGRSLSLGIADSVTVLSQDAVSADIAATLIANAVDLPGHKAIHRLPANELDLDSDLGNQKVVVDVDELGSAECSDALAPGVAIAGYLQRNAYIKSAVLSLGGQSRITSEASALEKE